MGEVYGVMYYLVFYYLIIYVRLESRLAEVVVMDENVLIWRSHGAAGECSGSSTSVQFSSVQFMAVIR